LDGVYAVVDVRLYIRSNPPVLQRLWSILLCRASRIVCSRHISSR
jgi:hypothetical protein